MPRLIVRVDASNDTFQRSLRKIKDPQLHREVIATLRELFLVDLDAPPAKLHLHQLTADQLAEHYLTNLAGGTGFLINPSVFWVRPGSAFLQTVHAAARRLGFLSLYLNLGQDQADDAEKQLQHLIDKALGWRRAQPWNTTLAGKLDLLQQRKRKKVALLMDGADRAWESEAGRNMMFALKAAREQLNLGRDEIGLLLMLAGTDEAGLRWLVRGNDAPFLGASVKELPQGVDVG